MSTHQVISEDCGIGCLRCGTHTDNDERVVTRVKAAGGPSIGITASDLANQIECRTHEGEPHHFVLAHHAIQCVYCGLLIDAQTPGDISPVCQRYTAAEPNG